METELPEPKVPLSKKTKIIILVIVVLLLAGGAAYYFKQKAADKKAEEEKEQEEQKAAEKEQPKEPGAMDAKMVALQQKKADETLIKNQLEVVGNTDKPV
ncbi:MAG: hypothetical protein JKY03_12580 [Aureispira sp.]|nr:hypothetical protein [Aureispira sp.]